MQNNEQLLAQKLNDLCIFLDQNFNINAGGCCFIASVIADCLEQDNISYETAVCHSDFKEFTDIGCNSQYHYFIILNGICINDDEENEYQIFEEVSAKDLMDHYLECTWNEEYDTSNNDFIEHLIKELYIKFYEGIFQGESNCICI